MNHNSTLVIVLDDGSHRVTEWHRNVHEEFAIAFTARAELTAQQRSRLHKVVAAYLINSAGDCTRFAI